MAAPVSDRRTTKKAAAPAAPPPPPPEPTSGSKRRSALVPALVLAVALLGAAVLLRGGKDTPPAPQVEASAPKANFDPAQVVALNPITLNLADGRFLKLGLALQLDPSTPLPPGDVGAFGAPALDEAITVFGTHTVADLSVPGAREQAKQELAEKVGALYDHHVVGVYLTQFVMQ
jgi:flagellar FliL protein